jgi:YVTN family beta-propeller protein
MALAMDSFNGMVYCANEESDDVSVISCSTNSVVATFPAHYAPIAVLTTLYGHTYVANNGWSSVTVIGDSAAAGVEESLRSRTTSRKPQATVVRGVLYLPEASSPKLQAASLLDAAGRCVMELGVGSNDVSHLAPGVYFVRVVSRRPSAVSCHKVVLAH